MKGFKHGYHGTPTYQSWVAMKNRCKYEHQDNWEYYGGRGINFDPAWNDFKVFLMEMGERPTGCTLDRINNNLGYNKENCRWASKQRQSNNRRDNVQYTYQGKTQTLKEWSVELGIKYMTLYQRIHRSNMPVEKAFGLR